MNPESVRFSSLLWRLAAAFILWNLAGLLLLPGYILLVTKATALILSWLRPHAILIELTSTYPKILWNFTVPHYGVHTGAIPFRLLSYNTFIYLSLVTAFPRLQTNARLAIAAVGLPLVLLFHVFDLTLILESRILSIIQPESYDFIRHFSLWFVLVKFYNFASIMALKPLAVILLFYAQWRYRQDKTE